VLAPADPESDAHAGDALVAGDTGLFALRAPSGGLPPLVVRHAGERMTRAVSFERITIHFDGTDFRVEREPGVLPARASRLLAEPEPEPEPEPARPAERPR
ncbi:MAG: hypothetical protein KDK70_36405, partial [Myxococcales bacterium]|nr:hypothetical protein [Myxococcales bacterium]